MIFADVEVDVGGGGNGVANGNFACCLREWEREGLRGGGRIGSLMLLTLLLSRVSDEAVLAWTWTLTWTWISTGTRTCDDTCCNPCVFKDILSTKGKMVQGKKKKEKKKKKENIYSLDICINLDYFTSFNYESINIEFITLAIDAS